MVDGSGLENRRGASPREFESHPLRQALDARRGRGRRSAADRSGLIADWRLRSDAGAPPARSTADRSSVAEPSGRGPGRGHSACAGGRGPSACSPGRGHSACVERLAWVAAREAQPRPAPSPRGRNPIDRFSGRCSSRQRMHRPDRGQSPRPRPATRVPSAGSASCDPPRALRHKWPGVIERGPAQGASCARGWLPPSP